MSSSIRRRVRKRRESLSSSSKSEGMSLGDETEYEDDEELDPFELNDRVRNLGNNNNEINEDFAPRMRLLEIEAEEDEGYTKEYRMQVLHRMLMRKIPLHQIARELGVSLSTVHRDKRELKEKLMEGAKKLNIHELIGETVGFYDEIGAMALRAASLDGIPANYRIAAMRTALGSKNDLHRFLNNAGVYDVLKFTPDEEQGTSDIEKLINATEQLLEDSGFEEIEETDGSDLQQLNLEE